MMIRSRKTADGVAPKRHTIYYYYYYY